VKQLTPAILAFTLMIVSGCGTGVRTYEAWQTPPVQSALPQTLVDLAVEGKLKSGSSLAVEFGVSGARLYELPPMDGAHVLTVTSKPRGTEHGLGIVYPRLRLLDAQRLPMREYPSTRFVYRDGLRVTIFLDPTRRRERYILITMDSVALDRLLRLQSMTSVPSSMLAPIDRGVLVLEFLSERVEHVPFP
jgi:hypothetical protein